MRFLSAILIVIYAIPSFADLQGALDKYQKASNGGDILRLIKRSLPANYVRKNRKFFRKKIFTQLAKQKAPKITPIGKYEFLMTDSTSSWLVKINRNNPNSFSISGKNYWIDPLDPLKGLFSALDQLETRNRSHYSAIDELFIPRAHAVVPLAVAGLVAAVKTLAGWAVVIAGTATTAAVTIAALTKATDKMLKAFHDLKKYNGHQLENACKNPSSKVSVLMESFVNAISDLNDKQAVAVSEKIASNMKISKGSSTFELYQSCINALMVNTTKDDTKNKYTLKVARFNYLLHKALSGENQSKRPEAMAAAGQK